jgi:hypothetical protein
MDEVRGEGVDAPEGRGEAASAGTGRDDRRRFLLKAGAAGAAGTIAWVAPVVQSSAAFAATSGPPPTNPQPCIPCGDAALVNGSFESNLAGWTDDGFFFVFRYDELVGGPTPPPGAGDLFVAMFTGFVKQTVPIAAECRGRPYTLSFWSTDSVPEASVTAELDFSSAQAPGPVTLAVPVGSGAVDLFRRKLTGNVPDDATSVTVAITVEQHAVPSGAVTPSTIDVQPNFAAGVAMAFDLIDFTICA